MLEIIKQILGKNKCKIRFHWYYDPDFETSKWDNNFNLPLEDYIEPMSIGPIKISQLKWLEINPIEIRKIGRLMPEKEINHTKEIIDNLNDNKVDFYFDGSLIKIENKDFNIPH